MVWSGVPVPWSLRSCYHQLMEAMVGNYCILLQRLWTVQIYTVTTPLHIAELLPFTVTQYITFQYICDLLLEVVKFKWCEKSQGPKVKGHDRWHRLLRNRYFSCQYFYTVTWQSQFKLNSHVKCCNILTKCQCSVVLLGTVHKKCTELENLT